MKLNTILSDVSLISHWELSVWNLISVPFSFIEEHLGGEYFGCSIVKRFVMEWLNICYLVFVMEWLECWLLLPPASEGWREVIFSVWPHFVGGGGGGVVPNWIVIRPCASLSSKISWASLTSRIPWGWGLYKEQLTGGELTCSLDTIEVRSKLHAWIGHMAGTPPSWDWDPPNGWDWDPPHGWDWDPPWLGLGPPSWDWDHPPWNWDPPSWDWNPPWLGLGPFLAGTGTPPELGPPLAGTGTPPARTGTPPRIGTPPGIGTPPIAEKLRLWRTNKCLLKLQYTYHFLITFLASFSLIVAVTNFTNLCTLTSEIYCKMSGIYHYLLIYFHLALGINC